MTALARLLCICALSLMTGAISAQDRGTAANPGDRLTLTPSWTVAGKQWTGNRVFERVK